MEELDNGSEFDGPEIPPHYYGDIIRKLFFGGGFVMLILLPLFSRILPVPSLISSLVIVLVAFVAALLSPKRRESVGAGVVFSALAVINFEYFAINTYSAGFDDWHSELFFYVNHVLAINFLVAFYFGVKTFRGLSQK